MNRILFICGTRPDAIKCAPVIKEFKKHSREFQTYSCVTGQHRSMLDSVLSFFDINPDFDLNIMKENQSLSGVIGRSLLMLEDIFKKVSPNLVIVQGDANPALAGSLSAYYHNVPIAHLEAGLRSGNIFSPYPEEGNRKIVSQLASLHFAPTVLAHQNLINESITKNVVISGNSVIDALLYTKNKIIKNQKLVSIKIRKLTKAHRNKKIILVTGHRRESFGKPLEEFCDALQILSKIFQDIHIIFPVHLNPNVKKTVYKRLNFNSNITLIEPVQYPDMVFLMMNSFLIISDSGGIQEEAPTLGKPIIITREITERQEAIQFGNALLSGMKKKEIVLKTSKLLNDTELYTKLSQAKNPFGDGNTSKIVVSEIRKFLKNS